jgi:hypothetical protein
MCIIAGSLIGRHKRGHKRLAAKIDRLVRKRWLIFHEEAATMSAMRLHNGAIRAPK